MTHAEANQSSSQVIMKKIFTLISLFIISGFAVQGATAYKSLVIEHTDTQLTKINLAYGTKTVFADGEMIMSYTKGGILYEFRKPLDEMRHWSFSREEAPDDTWARIDDVNVGQGIVIDFSGNRLDISNIPDAARISLTGLDGRTMMERTVSHRCSVDLSGFNTGVYILSVNDKTFKIAITR